VLFTLVQSPGVSADTIGRWENVMKASLPGDETIRARLVVRDATDLSGQQNLVPIVVIQRYNQSTFAATAALPDVQRVAPGVLVLDGPPAAPEAHGEGRNAVAANTGAVGIVVTFGTVVVLLFGAGLGWALALLPRDPVTVIGLAPGLALAAIILVTLGWDVVGLPLHGLDSLWPLAIATAGGWVAAWRVRARDRTVPDPVTLP
jgi:hypothetical protein